MTTSQLFRREQRECTCPHGERSLGRLYHVNMGRGIVRLSTTKGCPEHDTCHQWTAENRAKYVVGREGWAGSPWCPIHATGNCPKQPKVYTVTTTQKAI